MKLRFCLSLFPSQFLSQSSPFTTISGQTFSYLRAPATPMFKALQHPAHLNGNLYLSFFPADLMGSPFSPKAKKSIHVQLLLTDDRLNVLRVVPKRFSVP